MLSKYELKIDSLAMGLTKPATKCGVPFIPFYLSLLACFFSWMFYQALSGNTSIASIIIFLILWCAIYLAMLCITFNDPFGLLLFWINFTHFRKHRTFTFWNNTDSYAP